MLLPAAQPSAPTALRDDIHIEYFADVAPHSIRIERDPVSGRLHYITFEGDLYEMRPTDDGPPVSVRIATAEDHGITRLQGMEFIDSTLFLIGNAEANEGRGTKGVGMRGRLFPDGSRTWSTMFVTEEFGTTQTTFDHGFNATIASPDLRFLFINSGARTDHGEVQDNNGHYPEARDGPLNTAIFRIPVDARDLYLPDDLEELTARGYHFARGIRNAYDMAFSPRGHLFAVSNSGDYDHPEDMFWVREGHHYGFPWVMGGIENPQQYPDFQPDPEKDPFINPYSHAYNVQYLRNDPTFPKRPPDLKITPAVANIGPDANYFRDRADGRVKKGDKVGVALGTFTAHRSPLGLVFDVDSVLAPGLKGDGFVLSWTNGERSALMGRLSKLGSDLMHLKLFYSPSFDNYIVQSTRIVEGFNGPTDAELVDNVLYVIEYGGSGSVVWKITLPADRDGAVTAGPETLPHNN